MWKQHLFSKLISGPNSNAGLDEFHTITHSTDDEHASLMNLISRPGKMVTHGTFIQDAGKQFYIGVDDDIRGVLGENHPHAYEMQVLRAGPKKGRPINFVHGYFGSKDAKIPDIDELAHEQPKHLDVLLREAHEKNAYAGHPIDSAHVTFSKPRKEGTDWDRIAKEFEEGKHKGRTAIFTKEGKLREWLEPKVAQNTASAAETTAREGTKFFEKIPGGKWTAGIAAAAVVAGGGLALYEHNRSKEAGAQSTEAKR